MAVNPLLLPVRSIRQILGGDPGMRRIFHRFPSHKRCKQCCAPFLGVFAIFFRLIQIRPSRKNPNLCTI